MNFAEHMDKLELTPDNSVVIGSGIMQALGFHESDDLDIIVDEATYKRLKNSGKFKETQNYNRKILVAKNLEIGTKWGILGSDWTLNDLKKESTIINDVRYISLELLLRIKQDWKRPKDLAHIKKIEDYLVKNQKRN